MKLSRLDLNATLGADKERSHMIQRIINLTLDILYLLTGEDYIVLKMSYGRVTHSSSPCLSGGFGRSQISSLTPESNNDQKILEVTQKIIGLLTGEEGRRSVREKRLMFKSVTQDEDDVLRSEGGSRNPPERCPRPLYSGKKKNSSQTTVTFCVKKETNVPEQTTRARKRGRPRKRRIIESAPGPQSPPGSEDLHVITEDFQGEDEEVIGPQDDQQDKGEVRKGLRTGRSLDKLAPLSVIEEGKDEDNSNKSSKHICRSRRTAITEEEDVGESPGKDSDWEISADGSLHSMASDVPASSQDDISEDTILKISLDDIQEAPETGETADGSVCRNGKRKSFTCLDCRRCFVSSEQLESHHKVHTGLAPFSCTACGTSFTSSEELADHLKVHTSEKLYACSQCGKCFTIKANLIAHRRVHTGDKPFACAECGRRFALRSSLETHLPVHAMEKPYPCAMCGKCFTTSGRLAVHQTTHTGEKTYECEDCGKIFTTSSSMNRHRRTHTGEKPYSCSVCGKCFNRETNLYRHQMIHTR